MSKVIGDHGEDLAGEFLQEKGCEILARNFRNRFGEIDLIVKDKNGYVFVEVKFRKDEGYGQSIDFITKNKLKKILKTAKFYLYDNELENCDWRIDAIAIDGETEHIEWVKNIYTEGLA